MVKIPKFAVGKAKDKAAKQFTEIAYCCYIYGYLHSEEVALPFQVFCKKIKEIHEEGREEWTKQ